MVCSCSRCKGLTNALASHSWIGLEWSYARKINQGEVILNVERKYSKSWDRQSIWSTTLDYRGSRPMPSLFLTNS